MSENPTKDSAENVAPEEQDASASADAAAEASTDDSATVESDAPAEAAAPAGESSSAQDDGPTFGIAHAIGVSTPKDEFGPLDAPTGPVASEDALADGVEPDFNPGPALFVGFFVLAVALLAVGYGVGNVFLAEARGLNEERAASAVDPRLEEVRAAARAYTQEYAAREASGSAPALYQVPVTEAFAILEARPELFGGLPHGTATRGIDAPSRISNGAPIGQDWTAAVLEDPPAPVVIPEPVVAEGSGAEEGSGALDSESAEPTVEPSVDTE